MAEEDTSYVPPGLALFVAKAQATLQDATKLNFQSPSPAKSNTTNLSEEDVSFQIQEDDDDRRFKQEVMDKFETNHEAVLEANVDDSKAESILETANMLLALDDDGEGVELNQSDLLFPTSGQQDDNDDILGALTREMSSMIIDDEQKTANAVEESDIDLLGIESTADTPISPQGEGVEFTESDLISLGSEAVSSEKNLTGVQERAVIDVFSPQQNDVMFNDLLSKSVAPGCTSPLESAQNPKLSASTPELTNTSPFRNAIQSMVARLDSASPDPSPSSTAPTAPSPISHQSEPSPQQETCTPNSIPSSPSPLSMDKSSTTHPTATPPKSLTARVDTVAMGEVKDETALGISRASPVASSLQSAPVVPAAASPPNKVAITSPPPKTITPQAAVEQLEEYTKTKSDSAVVPSASTPPKVLTRGVEPVARGEVKDETTLGVSSASPVASSVQSAPVILDAAPPPNKETITSPPPKSIAPQVAVKHLEECTKTKSGSPSALTEVDAFFSPNRMPLAVETPLTHQPVQACGVSRRATEPRSNITARSKLRNSMSVTKKCIDRPRIPSSSTRTTVSMQSTSTAESTATSRLYQRTAATRAHSKVAAPPSSIEQRSKTSMDEGVMKAKERVRLQKLAAAKKANEVEAAEVKKPESRSSTRGSALSAEEGRKLALDRVRQHQEKENRVRHSNRKVENGITKRPIQGASASASHRVSTAALQRRITIPKSPQLATKATLREKVSGRSVRGSVSILNPNPITRALGSPTHGDKNKVTTIRISPRPRLTVPKAPRLSTSAKYGDKPTPSLRENPSLAQSMDLFMRKGLRDERSSPPPRMREHKLTIPKSPNFSTISQRAKPKSTAEMEEEMMTYYETHPFKAIQVGEGIEVDKGPATSVAKRRLTQPVPFHFRVVERATHSKPAVGSPDPEAKDLEECSKQFHARPLPRLSYNPPPRKEDGIRSVTTPKPFIFSTDNRVKSEPHGPTPDEVELSKQFHARPLPQTTYTEPKSRRQSGIPRTIITPRPPKLATSARTEPREASREASRKNAEMMIKRREEMVSRKKRDKHHEDMAKASMVSPPPNIEPFHLQSEGRHEAYQRQLAEQLAKDEEEKKRQMLFRARPLRISSPPPPIHSDRPATTPQPFPLQSLTLHEQWQAERRQQLEEEEKERQRLMIVKAIPLPRSTYKYSPVTPSSQKQLKQGDEERDLDSARKRAMEALLNAEEEMPMSEVSPAQDSGYYGLTRKALGI